MNRLVIHALLTIYIALSSFTIPADETNRPRRIGVLLVSWSPQSKTAQAFREGLRDAGYSEGRDLVIEWRFTEVKYGPVPGLVSGLIKHKVELMVVDTTVATRAVKQATSTIPVVMTSIANPVGSGLVTSLAHPGRNVTGLSIMATDLTSKRLQVLKDTLPALTRVAVLANPDTPYSLKVAKELQSAAQALAIEPKFTTVRTREDIEPAFTAARHMHAQALFVVEDAVFTTYRTMLVELAFNVRLPVIYGDRQFA